MSPLTMVGNEFKPQAPLPLKVKQVSLGKEIAFISHQERRLWKRRQKALSRTAGEFTPNIERSISIQGNLETHRMELRVEARATNLARGFLKGFPYSRIENACYVGNDPPFERAGEIAMKYAQGDTRVLKQTFEAWVQEGTLYYGANAINIDEKARYLQRLEARGRQLSLDDEEREQIKKVYQGTHREFHERVIGLDNGSRGPLAKVSPLTEDDISLSSLKPKEGDRL